jgi:hypothetical protein
VAHGGGTFFSFGDEFSPSYNCNLRKKIGQRCLKVFTKKLQKIEIFFGFSCCLEIILKNLPPIIFFIHIRIWHVSHLLLTSEN